MSKKPETLLKEKFVSELKKIKGIWFVKIQQVALRGIPDYLICAKGHFIAVELKDKDAKGSSSWRLQEFNLKRIGECGGMGIVVDQTNFMNAIQIIKEIIRG